MSNNPTIKVGDRVRILDIPDDFRGGILGFYCGAGVLPGEEYTIKEITAYDGYVLDNDTELGGWTLPLRCIELVTDEEQAVTETKSKTVDMLDDVAVIGCIVTIVLLTTGSIWLVGIAAFISLAASITAEVLNARAQRVSDDRPEVI